MPTYNVRVVFSVEAREPGEARRIAQHLANLATVSGGYVKVHAIEEPVFEAHTIRDFDKD